MKHLSNWIEIPVKDMKRAVSFYSNILGVSFHEMPMGPNHYALFPTEDRFNSGALVQGEGYNPSADGTVVYLDGGTDLSIILNKVEAAGGQVILEKMYLGDQAGYIGFFIDSEGNKIGLQHS